MPAAVPASAACLPTNPDIAVYGVEAETGAGARLDALRELRRVLRRDGRLLVTVPLGEPGDHGWFRQEDERGWTSLYALAGWFAEDGTRSAVSTPPTST